ncbi:Poly(ethylene terephthalate) hydrolase [Deinococcus saxicola]|uniref:alpha/beta hydrolase family protein n=1 Tax=Deinococcus saxicola TaxID=249406 RepID=UPI0039EE1C29
MALTHPLSPAPVSSVPAPVVSIVPVVLPAPERGHDLPVRVSAPATGEKLPIIVFSHGFSSSAEDYTPLVNFWAAHGFAVLQPTHLDSSTLALPPEDPRTPHIWRSRIADLHLILDHLGELEAALPGLSGRLDHSRIAAAGHSWGGTTASALLGARVLDAESGVGEDLSSPKVTAGVLLSTPGVGGPELLPFAADAFPFMQHPSFADMNVPTLIIAGDHDQSPLTSRGPEWFAEPYQLSPSPKSLLTLFGAEHSLGGVYGFKRTDTTDENPERVALIQQLTLAYLRSTFDPADDSWHQARAALEQHVSPLGQIVSK